MKKTIIVILALGLIASACSTYTCPTYAKAPTEEVEKAPKREKV